MLYDEKVTSCIMGLKMGILKFITDIIVLEVDEFQVHNISFHHSSFSASRNHLCAHEPFQDIFIPI